MAMIVHIHIGLEKTGSSSLQKHLQENTHWLLEQRVLYPIALRPAPQIETHLSLVAAVMRDDVEDDTHATTGLASPAARAEARRSLKAELEQEVSSTAPQSLVISSEHLSSRLTTSAEVERVRDLLNLDPDVRFLVHIYL